MLFTPTPFSILGCDLRNSTHFQLQFRRDATAAAAALAAASSGRTSAPKKDKAPAPAPAPRVAAKTSGASAGKGTVNKQAARPKAATPQAVEKPASKGVAAKPNQLAAAQGPAATRRRAATNSLTRTTTAAERAVKAKAAKARAAAARARARAKAAEAKDKAKKRAARAKAQERAKVQKEKEREKRTAEKVKEAAKKAARIRRAPSAYNLFVKEEMPALHASGSTGTSGKDSARLHMKILGDRWKALPAADKVKYQETSNALKAAVGEQRAKAKADRLTKRTIPAYNFFYRESFAAERSANPGMKTIDLARRIAKLWHGLPEEERRRYTDMEHADRRAKGLPPAAKASKGAKPAAEVVLVAPSSNSSS